MKISIIKSISELTAGQWRGERPEKKKTKKKRLYTWTTKNLFSGREWTMRRQDERKELLIGRSQWSTRIGPPLTQEKISKPNEQTSRSPAREARANWSRLLNRLILDSPLRVLWWWLGPGDVACCAFFCFNPFKRFYACLDGFSLLQTQNKWEREPPRQQHTQKIIDKRFSFGLSEREGSEMKGKHTRSDGEGEVKSGMNFAFFHNLLLRVDRCAWLHGSMSQSRTARVLEMRC